MIMKNISPLQLSSILVMLTFTKILKAEIEPGKCVEHSLKSVPSLNATCFKAQMPDIPANLSKNVEVSSTDAVTNIKKTIVQQSITRRSFVEYPDLSVLSFSHTNVTQMNDRNFLMSMKKLEWIEVSEKSRIPLFLNWSLPTSTKEIHFTGMEITNFELNDQDLPNLRGIDLTSNKLRTFPVLKPTYPLVVTALDNNPDIVITVEDLLPFCKLKYIVADSLQVTGSQYNTGWTVCHCLRLKRFIIHEQITTNFANFLCRNTNDENCSFEYDRRLLKIRDHCLSPTVPPVIAPPATTSPATAPSVTVPPIEGNNKGSTKTFQVIVLLLILIAVISVMGITFYLWKKRSNEPKEIVNNDEPELEEDSVSNKNVNNDEPELGEEFVSNEKEEELTEGVHVWVH